MANKTLFLAVAVLILLNCATAFPTDPLAPKEFPNTIKTQEFTIRTTWNNLTVPKDEQIRMRLTLTDKQLIVTVKAKFYNDPEMPNWIDNPQPDLTIFSFETVELFLLAPNEHYLQIDMSPKGQWMVMELQGIRQRVRAPVPIDRYYIYNTGKKWSASLYIDRKQLPEGIEKLNAYAMHGTAPNRSWMALSPAPYDNWNYLKANFHALELFQATDFFKTN